MQRIGGKYKNETYVGFQVRKCPHIKTFNGEYNDYSLPGFL